MNHFDESNVLRSKIGTFSERRHTAAGLTLTPDVEPESPKAKVARDYAAEIRSTDRNVSSEAQSALIQRLRLQVEGLGEIAGLSETDIDDAVGDSMLDLTRNYLSKGKPIGVGLVQVRGSSMVSQAAAGPIRHEAAAGIRVLGQKQEAAEIRAGRPLRDDEVETIAEQIREEWPDQRHRPPAGFHRPYFARPTVDVDLEQMVEHENAGNFDYLPEAPRSTFDDQWDDTIETSTKPELKRRLYELFADIRDLPQAVSDHIEWDVAGRVKEAAQGRIADIASQYTYGDATPRDVAALFAPFGQMAPSAKTQLANAFIANRDFADELWMSALSRATQSRSETARRRRVTKLAAKPPTKRRAKAQTAEEMVAELRLKYLAA